MADGRSRPVPDEAVVAVTDLRLSDGFCPHERACHCRARLRGSAWACLDALLRSGWSLTPPPADASGALCARLRGDEGERGR